MTGNAIEDHLLKAMLDVGLITQREYVIPKAFNFQRSSRTDKGVSAARLLVSFDLSKFFRVPEGNFRMPEGKIYEHSCQVYIVWYRFYNFIKQYSN